MSTPSPNLLQGSAYYVEAHRWLKRSGKMKWLLWPLLCSCILLPFYGYSVYFGTGYSLQWLVSYFGWQPYGWAYWLSFPLVLLSVLLLSYVLLKNSIMLLCIPMNALLADAVITEQLGAQTQSWRQLCLSMLRAVLMTLFSLVVSLLLSLVLLAISLIPVAGAIIVLILGIAVQGFLVAWGFFDPVFERAECGVVASFTRSMQLFPQMLITGAPFVVLFQIPVLGWALAPTYGTVAGALHACQLLKQGKLV